jgi:hypothetical protein
VETIHKGIPTLESTGKEIGEAIANVLQKKLYREKYANFEDFVKAEVGMGVSHVYRLVNYAHVEALLKASPIGENPPLPEKESQIRELARLKEAPERLRQAWARVVKESGDGKITAKKIKVVVDEMIAPTGRKAKSSRLSTEPQGPIPSELLEDVLNNLHMSPGDEEKKERVSSLVNTAFNSINGFLAKDPTQLGSTVKIMAVLKESLVALANVYLDSTDSDKQGDGVEENKGADDRHFENQNSEEQQFEDKNVDVGISQPDGDFEQESEENSDVRYPEEENSDDRYPEDKDEESEDKDEESEDEDWDRSGLRDSNYEDWDDGCSIPA